MDRTNSSTAPLKAQAKRLRTHFGALGHSLSHSQALEAVAKSHGFKDWNTACAGAGEELEGFSETARNLGICGTHKPGRIVCKLDHGHSGAHDYGKTGLAHRNMFDQMEVERDEARRMAVALRSDAGWEETWSLPWERVDGMRKVIVNGRPAEVPAKARYEDVVGVAFPGQAERIFSVTYRGVFSGILCPKESVRAEDGMIFNVADTSNA